jgi:hypothetical protein
MDEAGTIAGRFRGIRAAGCLDYVCSAFPSLLRQGTFFLGSERVVVPLCLAVIFLVPMFPSLLGSAVIGELSGKLRLLAPHGSAAFSGFHWLPFLDFISLAADNTRFFFHC